MLDHMVVLFLVCLFSSFLKNLHKSFFKLSIVAAPTYIPTNSVGGYSDHFESAKKHNKKADR